MNGSATHALAAAESSSPTGNATIAAATPVSGGSGGCHSDAFGGEARSTINNSGNETNRTSQLAMATTTVGQSNLQLT
ncbi:MAG: hypothetical protein KA354_21780 [Phycisphaerae bacterium]|nr:hypothetical protein [Phycisphaerae bacterium]